MSANKSLVEYPSGREMVFTRVLAAPRELVWAAWTDPEQVVLWWGPKGFTNTTHAMDVRPGGIWRFTMHGPDGTDWPNLITYHVVQAPARLEYDHGDEAKPKWFHVVVDFVAEGAQTKIVTHMSFERAEDCENAKKYGIEGQQDLHGATRRPTCPSWRRTSAAKSCCRGCSPRRARWSGRR
ncbi:MAG: SRPBCC family protein [Lacunisphaera sp.]